jgi:hypothetical protein
LTFLRAAPRGSCPAESFDTTAFAPLARDPVQAHADSGESVCLCLASEGWECQTWDYELCGDTNYLDCTFGCTDFASCQGC